MKALIAACAAVACTFAGQAAAAGKLPRPDHVVIVIEENRSYREVVGSPEAPYLTSLARTGANFTNAHGITHPSAPNYFALFAGLTNSNGDDCPERGISPDAPNLASELLAAHLTFTAYSGSLPQPGFEGCWAGTYARKHAPWVSFHNVPPSLHVPFRSFPPPERLPTVSFVVPNVDDDMHDGSTKQGDEWFQAHLNGLIQWAGSHNTLVIVLWDEGYDRDNTIPVIFYGPMVKRTNSSQRMNAYVILRTIESMYGLPVTGHAADVAPANGVWR